MNNEKLNAMVDALWPLLRARIESEYVVKRYVQSKKDDKVGKSYLPELDYLVALYRARGEVRHSILDPSGKIKVDRLHDKDRPCYCVSASGTMESGEFVDKLIVPSKTIMHYDVGCGITMKNDYRSTRAMASYVGGLLDHNGEKLFGSASCYAFNLAKPITKEIITYTRREWQGMTEAERSKRIVSYDHMMETLDILEQGQVLVNQQVDMWRVLVDRDGREYTHAEATKMHPASFERILPRKIVPTWMGDDV